VVGLLVSAPTSVITDAMPRMQVTKERPRRANVTPKVAGRVSENR
jgi:hypothetical protein